MSSYHAMGRIKTRTVKAATRDLHDKHSDELEKDFNSNKQIVSSKMNVNSKKLKNIIAGYTTRLKKSEEK